MTDGALNSGIVSSKVAFFLGAGASVPLSLPDSSGFIVGFEQRLRSQGHGFAEWLSAASTAAGTSDVEVLLDAIEDWLSTLESVSVIPAQNLAEQLAAHVRPVVETYKELVTAIRREVVETYGRVSPDEAFSLYKPILLDVLLQRGVRRTIPVFTTNYDTAIEAFADQAATDELQLVDGFRHTSMGLRWEATNYRKYQRGRKTGIDIVLFKLHGSSNWYRMQGGSIEKNDNFELDPGNLKNIMIFPTQRKAEYLGNEPFDTSYGYFKACLARLRLLIVVGFSFRDAEIRRLIWQTLKARSNFHLFVIDPGFTKDSVVERLSEGEIPDYVGKIDMVPSRFGKELTTSIIGEATSGTFSGRPEAPLMLKT